MVPAADVPLTREMALNVLIERINNCRSITNEMTRLYASNRTPMQLETALKSNDGGFDDLISKWKDDVIYGDKDGFDMIQHEIMEVSKHKRDPISKYAIQSNELIEQQIEFLKWLKCDASKYDGTQPVPGIYLWNNNR